MGKGHLARSVGSDLLCDSPPSETIMFLSSGSREIITYMRDPGPASQEGQKIHPGFIACFRAEKQGKVQTDLLEHTLAQILLA
jgi:hypothetical protein